MPRMSKKMKLEWALFIGSNGRRQYNELSGSVGAIVNRAFVL